MIAALALVVLSQSPNADAELFADRGESFLRAGQASGLEVGAALEVIDAKTRLPVGTATVMEVWPSLARVSLDSKASGHAPLKLARVSQPAQRAERPVAVAPPAAVPPARVVGPRPSAGAPVGPPLDGEASVTGAGDLRRVTVRNRTSVDWHDCDLRLPDGRHYELGSLDQGERDGVMLFRFVPENGPTWARIESVALVCAEGVGQFPIAP